MKRFTALAMLVATALISVGCQGNQLGACRQCGSGGGFGGRTGAGHGGGLANHGPLVPGGGHHFRPNEEPKGPETATVAYPYYTLRGPRDFLARNPPSIGP